MAGNYLEGLKNCNVVANDDDVAMQTTTLKDTQDWTDKRKQTTLLVRLPARPKSKVIVFKIGESHSSSTREPASMFVIRWMVILTSV